MSSEEHSTLLKLHCRICGQKRVDGTTNRGVQIRNHPQLIRWLRYLHDIEVERESEEIYPIRSCDGCIGRLRNVSICHKDTQKKAMENVFELATKLHTEGLDDEITKLSRHFPAADFWAHSSSGMCSICDDSQKDSFPGLDFSSHLLIEVENNDQGDFKICKFSKTSKPVVVKRPSPVKNDTAKSSESEKPPDKPPEPSTSSQPQPPEAKKSKLDIIPINPEKKDSNPPAITTAKVSSISSGQAWLQFIDALGRNRRSRCDKLADLLKWSNADNPKVLSDLKASGLTYKILEKRHTPRNVEFKSTLAKCKRLLTAFPLGKRALMLFRAITDTVTDGRTDLMSHVGIFIDLSHPNMAFLKRKIQAKKAEMKEQERIRQEQEKIRNERATRAAASVKTATPKESPTQSNSKANAATKAQVKETSQTGPMPKLPSGITISKVKEEKNSSSPNTRHARGAVQIKEEPQESMLMERPDLTKVKTEPEDGPITINEAKVKKAYNDIEKKYLPANRQMKTDVVFDCLHLREDSPALLAEHGIIYNPKLGKHHLKVLSTQRKSHKNGIIKATENMNKLEWASVMAQIIFGLLHTEDTLTLRVAGIMIDPFHPAPPLSFRMGFMLKHLLISQDDPALARNILSHMLKSCDIEPTNSKNDKYIEDGLIQLLYCDRPSAKELVASTKKPIKISIKSALAGKQNMTAAAASAAASAAALAKKPAITLKLNAKGAAATKNTPNITPKLLTNSGRPTRKVVYKEEPEFEAIPSLPKTVVTTKRGRATTRTAYTEDTIVEPTAVDPTFKAKSRNTPAKKPIEPNVTKPAPVAAPVLLPPPPPPGPAAPAGPRGKYKKSAKQLQKEARAAKAAQKKAAAALKPTRQYNKKAPNPGLMPLPLHVQQSIQQTQLPNPFGPNVMVEVPPEDPLDPLAMPDPSLVNPMDVEIKTEVFDDEPMTMEGSMITDDPYAHPDEGDVSNLLISSVVSGNDQEFEHNIETDIEIQDSNLSPDANSTSSMDIDYNPIPDTGLGGIGTHDPFGTPDQSNHSAEPILDDTNASDDDDNEMESRNDTPQKIAPKVSNHITNLSWINSPTPSPEPSPEPPAVPAVNDNSVDASWINSPVNPEPEVPSTEEPDTETTGNGQPEEDPVEETSAAKEHEDSEPEDNFENESDNLQPEADDPIENGLSNGLNENSNEESSKSLGGCDPLDGGNGNEMATNFHDSLNQNNTNNSIAPSQVSNNLSNNMYHNHHQNGGQQEADHDPFGGAGGTSFGSNDDFHSLLSSNSLENGDTPPPTLLDEDANDLLNQLVGYQTSKEMHSTTENSSAPHF